MRTYLEAIFAGVTSSSDMTFDASHLGICRLSEFYSRQILVDHAL